MSRNPFAEAAIHVELIVTDVDSDKDESQCPLLLPLLPARKGSVQRHVETVSLNDLGSDVLADSWRMSTYGGMDQLIYCNGPDAGCGPVYISRWLTGMPRGLWSTETGRSFPCVEPSFLMNDGQCDAAAHSNLRKLHVSLMYAQDVNRHIQSMNQL